MPMFTRGISHKEVDFIIYIYRKFVDLKDRIVKELKDNIKTFKHNINK